MRAHTAILLLACAAVALAGPAMGVQEYLRESAHARAVEDAKAREELTGETTEIAPLDFGYRAAWRVPLFALVAAIGVMGTIVFLAVARRRRMRAVSGRLLALLLAGMTILDLAYLLDLEVLSRVAPSVRAQAVTFLYPLAAALVAGSAYRLDELEPVFGSDAPARPLL